MRFALHYINVVSAALILLFSSFSAYAEKQCEIGNITPRRVWNGAQFGNRPTLCLLECEYRSYGDGVSSLCFVSSGDCTGRFISTGGSCTKDGLYFGGEKPSDKPQPPTNPDSDPNSASQAKWAKEDFSCSPSNDGKFNCTGLYHAFAKLETSSSDKIDRQTYDLLLKLDSATLNVISAVSASNENLNQNLSKVGGEIAASNAEVSKEVKALVTSTNESNEASKKQLEEIKAEVDKLYPYLDNDLSEYISNKIRFLDFTVRSEHDQTTTRLTREITQKSKTLLNAINNNQNTLEANQSNLKSQVGNVNRNLNTNFDALSKNVDGMEASMNAQFGDLNAKIDALELGNGGNQDGVIGAVNAVGSKIDGLGTSLGNIGDQLGDMSDLLGGKGLNKGEHNSLVAFNELPLYQDSDVTQLNTDVEALKSQYNQKVQDFKSLFSFNASSLSNGEFVDHTLNFSFANGGNLSATSSVFPALVRNSGTISAVILFIAVIAGLRVVMGAKD
ncbi:hypothetical protein QNF08_004176 [Vibrio vulnificus]|nr:hypothetical protein [Vibrio vulnificus]ELV8737890.1 hypothetical protein [Vibrio vulnificus]